MSVLASQRTLSKHEYVNTFQKLYDYTIERIGKLPKRKQRWLGEPIIIIMNELYNMIMESNNDYYHYGIKLVSEKERAQLMISKLQLLQKPLFALWNIEKYETKKMVNWVKLIEEEIGYISRLGGLEYRKNKNMFIIDYDAIENARFLKTMVELHRKIYSKTIVLKESIRMSNGTLLMELSDEALFHLILANLYYPKTKKIYEYREKHLNIAINCIKQMQQPFISIFIIEGYSERVMIEISELINEEIKLLTNLQKSDKKRFGALT